LTGGKTERKKIRYSGGGGKRGGAKYYDLRDFTRDRGKEGLAKKKKRSRDSSQGPQTSVGVGKLEK